MASSNRVSGSVTRGNIFPLKPNYDGGSHGWFQKVGQQTAGCCSWDVTGESFRVGKIVNEIVSAHFNPTDTSDPSGGERAYIVAPLDMEEPALAKEEGAADNASAKPPSPGSKELRAKQAAATAQEGKADGLSASTPAKYVSKGLLPTYGGEEPAHYTNVSRM